MTYKEEKKGLIIGLEIAKHRILTPNSTNKGYRNMTQKRDKWEIDNKRRIVISDLDIRDIVTVKLI